MISYFYSGTASYRHSDGTFVPCHVEGIYYGNKDNHTTNFQELKEDLCKQYNCGPSGIKINSFNSL